MTNLNDILNLSGTDKVIKLFFILNVLYKSTVFLYSLISIILDEHLLLPYIIFVMILSMFILFVDVIVHYDIFYMNKTCISNIFSIWHELTPTAKGFWLRSVIFTLDAIVYCVGSTLLTLIDKNKDDIAAVVITNLHLLFIFINGNIFLLYTNRHMIN